MGFIIVDWASKCNVQWILFGWILLDLCLRLVQCLILIYDLSLYPTKWLNLNFTILKVFTDLVTMAFKLIIQNQGGVWAITIFILQLYGINRNKKAWTKQKQTFIKGSIFNRHHSNWLMIASLVGLNKVVHSIMVQTDAIAYEKALKVVHILLKKNCTRRWDW